MPCVNANNMLGPGIIEATKTVTEYISKNSKDIFLLFVMNQTSLPLFVVKRLPKSLNNIAYYLKLQKSRFIAMANSFL
jgi:hypothetical protein